MNFFKWVGRYCSTRIRERIFTFKRALRDMICFLGVLGRSGDKMASWDVKEAEENIYS